VWAGVDSAWEQEKPEARKMLAVGAADSHTSGAPPHEKEFMFHRRNRGAMGVYCKVADTKAVQSNGDALVAVPRCTMVSDQNDVSTGGAKKLAMKQIDPD